LKAEIETLSSSLRAVESELALKSEALESSELNLTALKENMQICQKENAVCVEDLSEAKKECSKLSAAAAALEKQCSDLTVEGASHTENTTAALRDSEKRAEELRERVAGLKEDLDRSMVEGAALQKKVDVMNKMKESLTETVGGLEAEVSKKEEEMLQLKGRCKELEDRLADSAAEIADLKKELSLAANMESDRAAATEQDQTATHMIKERLKEVTEKHKVQLADLRAQLSAAHDAQVVSEKATAALNRQIKEATEEIKKAESARTQAVEEISSMTAQMEVLKAAASSAKAEEVAAHEDLKRKLDEFTAGQKETLSALRSAEEGYEEAVRAQEAMVAERESLSMRLGVFVGKAAEMEALLAVMTSEKKQQEKERVDHVSTIASMQAEKTDLESKVRDLSDKCKGLQLSVDESSARLEESAKKQRSMEEMIAALERSDSAKAEEVAAHEDLKRKLDEFTAGQKETLSALRSAEEGYEEAMRAQEAMVAERESLSMRLGEAEGKAAEVEALLAVMTGEKEESDKVKERTKATVATMLEKLKHFKAIADEKKAEVAELTAQLGLAKKETEALEALLTQTQERVRVAEAADSERAAESLKMAEDKERKNEHEMRRAEDEGLRRAQESSDRDAAAEALRQQLVSVQVAHEEGEGKLKVYEEMLAGYTNTIKEKADEVDELKRYLHELKIQLEGAVSRAEKAEGDVSIAQKDLSELSERYVQSQEERTASSKIAAEQSSEALNAQKDLKEAILALEGRDAQLFSYADHVAFLEKKLTQEGGAVGGLQHDLQDTVQELQKVQSYALALAVISVPFILRHFISSHSSCHPTTPFNVSFRTSSCPDDSTSF
jgi:chromosome segregation ATPase